MDVKVGSGAFLPGRKQADELAHTHRFLDECGDEVRCGDGEVDAPVLVEEPLVLGVIDPRDHTGDGELGLGEERDDEVVFVVAGGSDHDIAALETGLGERGHLAGVGDAPFDALARDRALPNVRLLLDEEHVVPVLAEVVGDVDPDCTRSGDAYAHVSAPVRARVDRGARRAQRCC